MEMEAAFKINPKAPPSDQASLFRVLLEDSTVGAWEIALAFFGPRFSFLPKQILSPSSFEALEQPVRYAEITQRDLPPGERYILHEPIPVKIVRDDSGLGFTATFEEANLSIGGESFHDAFQALVLELLDTFDYLNSNRDVLGPEPQHQVEVLTRYLGPAHR